MKNIRIIIAFIVGAVIAGSTVYVLALNGAEVGYDNTSSGMSATNVQDALDELYTKAQNMVPIDPDTFNTNTAKLYMQVVKGFA